MINDTIRIRLSLGLIVVAIIHAVLLGVVFTALHQPVLPNPTNETWAIPTYRPSTPTSAGKIEKLQEPQSVNLQAQGEVKQQIRICPQDCPPTRVYPAPVIVHPTIVQPSVVGPSVVTPVSPTPNFTTPATPSVEVSTVLKPATSPASPPPKKSYQIALFVGNDSTSKMLQDWFSQDRQLVSLKESCEFQIYTAGNPIYKTRYADIVPVEQFPVVLFQDATGGHIHAAGRTMIPSTPAELYSDLKHG